MAHHSSVQTFKIINIINIIVLIKTAYNYIIVYNKPLIQCLYEC